MTHQTRHPYLLRRQEKLNHELPSVDVSETNGIRSLHLGSETVQSSMDINDSKRLVLAYSRAMMSWLLFNDAPQKILQIGLGGGSFSRWIAHYLPNTQSIAVDINPQVINIARSLFKLPPENDKFQIIEADGAVYVQIFRNSCDAILVDAFDGEQIIEELTEEAFFTNCLHALSNKGVFVANWWSGDARYLTFLQRLLKIFAGRVIEVPASSHGNIVVIAFREPPDEYHIDALLNSTKQLSQRFELDFDALMQLILANNQHSQGRFIFD